MRGCWLLTVVFVTAPGCVTVGPVAPEPVAAPAPIVPEAPPVDPPHAPTPVPPTPEPVEQPTTPVEPPPPQPSAAAVEEGVASFYARRFEGRRTASGERYRRKLFTCAHREHPFGTILRVTAVESGKQATCRVNDRGPFKKSRVLDVSGAVARELGMVGPGILLVRVTVDTPAGAAPAEATAPTEAVAPPS